MSTWDKVKTVFGVSMYLVCVALFILGVGHVTGSYWIATGVWVILTGILWLIIWGLIKLTGMESKEPPIITNCSKETHIKSITILDGNNTAKDTSTGKRLQDPKNN